MRSILLKEFFIDCIARDDYEALRKVGTRHLDIEDLELQMPAILRACRQMEEMVGQDDVSSAMSHDQRLTLLELAHFATAHSVLLRSSRLPFPNDTQLVAELLERMQKSDYLIRQVKQALSQSVLAKQTKAYTAVIDFLIAHKRIRADELYELYELTLKDGKNACPEIFDRLFTSGLLKVVLKAAKQGLIQVVPELMRDINRRREKSEDEVYDMLAKVMQ